MLYLFEYRPEEPLNSAESCTRKAFDYMHWSSVKKDAVKTICKLDENQSELSYYLPNIRYHTRWKELSENDFTYAKKSQHYELKGYAPFSHYGRNQILYRLSVVYRKRKSKWCRLWKNIWKR